MHCSAAGTGRSVYWNAFAYYFVPTAKDLENTWTHAIFLLSLDTGHPTVLARLIRDRKPKRVNAWILARQCASKGFERQMSFLLLQS